MASGGDGPSGGVMKEGWLQKRGKRREERWMCVSGGWSSR